MEEYFGLDDLHLGHTGEDARLYKLMTLPEQYGKD
jgi:hypothetical protein